VKDKSVLDTLQLTLSKWPDPAHRLCFMRAVIQRVPRPKSPSLRRHGRHPSRLAVLVAVEAADTAEDIEWLSGKIVRRGFR